MSDKLLAETRRREQLRMKRAYENDAEAKEAIMIMKQLKLMIHTMKLDGTKSAKVNIHYNGALIEMKVNLDGQESGGWI
jgi:hypothetical protein